MISLCGSGLDVLGGLYLAYDILGGQHGPLRLLTRAVTYSLVFGLGYGLGLGMTFGLFAGIASGVTIAIELHRESRGRSHYPLPLEAFFSAIRGAAFGAGLYPAVGSRFAAAFAILATGGQVVAYTRGVRPGMDYVAARRPRFTERQFKGTVVRILAQMAASLLCSVVVRHLDHPWMFAIRLGLVTGLATSFGTAINPYIEWYADNLPERRLGAFGVGLILVGFGLQSLQYWISLLDVRVI